MTAALFPCAKLFAVPGLAWNTHGITVEGEFRRLEIEVENVAL